MKLFFNFSKNLDSEKNKLLESKEREIQELNDKYRSYLEKAKIVIKSLDPLKNTNTNTTNNVNNSNGDEQQFNLLKTQLAEKDKHIRALNKDIEKLKSTRIQEEELVASAWYHLGAQLNRRATDERISSIGNSFLSQQRHLQPSLNNNTTTTTTSTSTSSNNSSFISSSNRMRIPSANNNNNNNNKSLLNTSITNNQTASASS